MNRNLKMILTIGVLATAGYFIYKYYNQKTLENPDTGSIVGGDDKSPIIYDKKTRQVQVNRV
jgi:hypothetical protein